MFSVQPISVKETILFPALFGLGRLLPFGWLKKASALPVLPLYHAVSERPSPYVEHVGVWRSTQQFKADLDFLLKHYEPVGLEDLLAGRKTKRPPLHLTFDDGLAECYTTVFPLLKARGIPATFFVNSAFVDNKSLFFRFKASLIIGKVQADPKAMQVFRAWLQKQKISTGWQEFLLSVRYGGRTVLEEAARELDIDFAGCLKQRPCYMSMDELQQLEKAGFTIGAHSIDHPRYDALPLDEQIRQTVESLDFVSRHFHPPARTFAFPFTDFGAGRNFFDELEQKAACSLSFGCAGLKRDAAPKHLQRIPFDENQFTARSNLSKEYLYFLLKAPLGRNVLRRN
ncbi:MAG: polysaccharide deacetylase family protein [Phaeodactylibacter sp.]|nr:polysaccharide deacetylase family protein [Phaeodactylibacter sp.]MCB9288867.1 polysaccharide deacetylase family protein [Lewinellaceae bacterium]